MGPAELTRGREGADPAAQGQKREGKRERRRNCMCSETERRRPATQHEQRRARLWVAWGRREPTGVVACSCLPRAREGRNYKEEKRKQGNKEEK